MRQHWIILVALLMPLSIFAEDVKFENNLVTAKQKALNEGKLIMLDFTAGWCTPCKFMEEHTFTDTRVQQQLKTNYVPVKVDIDDFDGFALKQTFKVQVLPTIIFLNSKGEFVARHEESMAASRLLELMGNYNKPQNKVSQNTGNTSTPSSTSTSTTTTKPTSTTTNNTTDPVKTSTINDLAAVTGEGLFRFQVTRQASRGYSVQVGVFSQYENVLTQVAKFQKKYPNKDVLVNINSLNGKVVYKILLGIFDDTKDASSFKKSLLTDGLDRSFIINLRRYK